jgi:hypothetical protein
VSTGSENIAFGNIAFGNIAPFARTLEQELVALLRGASLECLVCGEFVMHARDGVVFCPECGSQLGDEDALVSAGSPRARAGTAHLGTGLPEAG